MKTEKRPRLNPRTEIAVWAAAAGRCTFCNRLVTENEDLGTVVLIGELAHNVGWGKDSPRGEFPKLAIDRSNADNLLLLCRNCHKPIDDKGIVGYYAVDVLTKLKQEHEARIRLLTEIGADRKAIVVRLVGPVRGVNPELTYNTVLAATIAAGIFPDTLPNFYRNAIEIDLREYSEGTSEAFAACIVKINDVVASINEGIKRDKISQLAIFAFARIPLLVYLGARIDDKVPTLIFQRQRIDDQNAWRWPENPPEPPTFIVDKLQAGSTDLVALTLNISGTIQLRELPQDIQETYTIYGLAPVVPAMSGPTVISSLEALKNFEHTIREFFAHVEKEHGKIPKIAIFPAVPISCAIILGRALMPHVSPSLVMYDRNEQKEFFFALEVHK